MSGWNLTPIPQRVSERAITRVVEQEDGCWISTYSRGSHGYAQIGWRDDSGLHMVLAHRAAWAHVEGEVPPDMTLDHICKVRPCVNPSHLRLLSNVENARRNQGDDFPIGFCRNGHSDSDRIPVTRRNKSGATRTGFTCGPCAKEASERWEAANPDKRRAAWTRYNQKRRAA